MADTEYQKRVEAIKAILNKEKTQSQVAREFGMTRQAVSLWIKKYKESGTFMKTVGRGRTVHGITPEQRDEYVKLVRDSTPSDHGIMVTDDMWCYEALGSLMRRRFGRKFSLKFCFSIMEEAGVEHLSFADERILELSHIGEKQYGSDEEPDAEVAQHQMMSEEDLEYYKKKVAEARREMAVKGKMRPPKRGAAFTKSKKKKKKNKSGKKKKK